MKSSDFSLESYDGRKLWCTLDQPEIVQGPLVVMSHGLLGFKDWAFFPYVAHAFVKAGFPVLRFNFSGCGMEGNQDGPFTDLAAFEHDTITRQVEDLRAVVSAARAGRVPNHPSAERMLLWGHSRGGGVSLLAAVRNPDVSAVATWATISRVNRYPVDITREWRRLGYRDFESSRTGQVLRSSSEFLEDLEKWNSLGDIPVEAFRLRVPVLLVHGQEDVSVKANESESLAAVIPAARLLVVAGGDHKFNVKHPFEGPSEPLSRALEATILFWKETSGIGSRNESMK
jgi:pimeloyl-ACP methyl ester carboxylesterase